MTPVTLNIGSCVFNLILYVIGRRLKSESTHISLGCAIISGSVAIAYYYF